MIKIIDIDDVAIDQGVISCPEPGTLPRPAGYAWQWEHDAGTPGTSCGNSSLVTSPTVLGTSRRFDFSSNGYGGERFHIYLGLSNLDSTSVNFRYETMVYIEDPTHISILEFDLNQVIPNGKTVIYGMQLNFGIGKVQYTTNVAGSAHWNDSNVSCTPLSAHAWHSLVFQYHRDAAGIVTYDSIVIDGVLSSFVGCSGDSAFSLGWTPVGTLLVNFQMDGDGSLFSAVAYLDGLEITGWLTGELQEFQEIDVSQLFPGRELRASIVQRANDNILEATNTPEVFPAVTKTNGQTVALPVGADGYPYVREEIHYVWWWKSTGPESNDAFGRPKIRLPLFRANVDQATGLVTIVVWRLRANAIPELTNDGSIVVVPIGMRQRQIPEISATEENPPTDLRHADEVRGSIVITTNTGALSGQALFTVPLGRGGLYRVTFTAKITRVASGGSPSSTLGGFTLHYTDNSDNQASVTPTSSSSSGNSLSTQINGSMIVNMKENTDVTFDFDYASAGTILMMYTVVVAWDEVVPTGGPLIGGVRYNWLGNYTTNF